MVLAIIQAAVILGSFWITLKAMMSGESLSKNSVITGLNGIGCRKLFLPKKVIGTSKGILNKSQRILKEHVLPRQTTDSFDLKNQ